MVLSALVTVQPLRPGTQTAALVSRHPGEYYVPLCTNAGGMLAIVGGTVSGRLPLHPRACEKNASRDDTSENVQPARLGDYDLLGGIR